MGWEGGGYKQAFFLVQRAETAFRNQFEGTTRTSHFNKKTKKIKITYKSYVSKFDNYFRVYVSKL